MAWKSIAPQPVTATVDGIAVVVSADRWEDFTGAIAVAPPGAAVPPAERIMILAGEYSPLDEAEFEQACSDGTRV